MKDKYVNDALDKAESDFLKSSDFSKSYMEIVKRETWDKGLPMIYQDKKGNLVKHFKNGLVEIIKEAKTEIKYYFYSNINQGERYFRVIENQPVLQIVDKTVKKKGRPYQHGVGFITYITFISSWGWKLSESKNISEITKAKFYNVLDKLNKEFYNEKS